MNVLRIIAGRWDFTTTEVTFKNCSDQSETKLDLMFKSHEFAYDGVLPKGNFVPLWSVLFSEYRFGWRENL